MDWAIEGQHSRKSLRLRDRQAAQQRARQTESTGFVAKKTAISIDKALENFLADVGKDRKLKPSEMQEYKLLSRAIR
jgi:hypothetical protein